MTGVRDARDRGRAAFRGRWQVFDTLSLLDGSSRLGA